MHLDMSLVQICVSTVDTLSRKELRAMSWQLERYEDGIGDRGPYDVAVLRSSRRSEHESVECIARVY